MDYEKGWKWEEEGEAGMRVECRLGKKKESRWWREKEKVGIFKKE